nr:unnamed protein product [Callosobruchus chinensis]
MYPLLYKELSIEQPGWTKLLALAGLATALGLSLPVGYNIGVVNSPASIIRQFCNDSISAHYGAAPSESALNLVWSAVVCIFIVGAAVGSLGGSALAARLGRKGVLVICAALAALAALMFFACKAAGSVEMLVLGRLLAGLSAGLTTCVMPMYLTELAPLRLKGAMGVLCPLGLTFGVLAGQVISMNSLLGNDEYWPHCLAIYALPTFVSILILPILPESPKFLFVVKNQPYAALKELQKIRGVQEELLKDEIESLKIEAEENKKNTGDSVGLRKVITDRSLLLPLTLVCCLQAGQQFSGINAVFYYSTDIFKAAGLTNTAAELATIGAGIFNFAMAAISVPLMSSVDRRTCILFSLETSIAFLIVLGLGLTYIQYSSWVAYVSIVGLLGFVICYGIGLGPIPYFIGSELFEVGPRPSAMALGSMFNWGGNFIVGLLFPILKVYIGAAWFFIFAAITLALFVFVRFYLPETRGRDTSEIAHICRNGFASRPLQGSTIETHNINTENQELEKINDGNV